MTGGTVLRLPIACAGDNGPVMAEIQISDWLRPGDLTRLGRMLQELDRILTEDRAWEEDPGQNEEDTL